MKTISNVITSSDDITNKVQLLIPLIRCMKINKSHTQFMPKQCLLYNLLTSKWSATKLLVNEKPITKEFIELLYTRKLLNLDYMKRLKKQEKQDIITIILNYCNYFEQDAISYIFDIMEQHKIVFYKHHVKFNSNIFYLDKHIIERIFRMCYYKTPDYLNKIVDMINSQPQIIEKICNYSAGKDLCLTGKDLCLTGIQNLCSAGPQDYYLSI